MADFVCALSEIFNFIYTWISCAIIALIPRTWRLKDVSNEIVLITGGASGFGRELALKFSELGSKIVIWDINEKFLQETQKMIEERGNKCYSFVCDVTDRNDVYAKAETVKKEVGNVTILVNNAGVVDSKSLLNLNDDFVERTFKVNILSHIWTCKAFLPSMINANKGHIVSIASVLGLQGTSKLDDYCATKSAAIMLMEALYYELNFAGHCNIKLTTVCPYQMDTGMFAGVNSKKVPPLDPKATAQQTVNAIRADEDFVIFPSYFKLCYLLKPFLPMKCLFMLMKFLEADAVIDKFVVAMNIGDIIVGFFLALFYWLRSIVLFFVPRKLRLKDVSKETVLITGGGGGFGRLLAIKFGQLGSKVVVWDIDDNALQQTKHLVKKFGGECHVYVCDVTNRKEVYKVADKVKHEVGNVTILVNNAGIVSGKPFFEIDDNMIEKTYQVNVLAHYWTCKAFLPSMIEAKHGHIVSIASVSGLNAVPHLTDYSASKFAAVGFQESLSLETYFNGHRDINFTTICPYFMNTGMFDGANCDVFAMLEPEYCADQTMSAILSNQEFVVLPRFFYLTYALKTLLPWKAYLCCIRGFNFQKLMHTFKGKKQN
ncbi:Short-chain dehydrogenase/reductase family 16C member 6-like protein, partial [Leptotrombidium deliense]